MKSGLEPAKQERRAINEFRVIGIGKTRNEFSVQDAVEQRGNREEKTHDRSRGANVEKRAIGAHPRTNHDECAKCADKIGEGNEKRIAGVKAMVAAGEEVSQFMRKQNAQQGDRKRKSGEQPGGIFVEESEAAKKHADGCGLIVRIGEGKLSSGDETRTQSQEEKHNGENERFPRRAGRNLGVIPLADEIVAPIQVVG